MCSVVVISSASPRSIAANARQFVSAGYPVVDSTLEAATLMVVAFGFGLVPLATAAHAHVRPVSTAVGVVALLVGVTHSALTSATHDEAPPHTTPPAPPFHRHPCDRVATRVTGPLPTPGMGRREVHRRRRRPVSPFRRSRYLPPVTTWTITRITPRGAVPDSYIRLRRTPQGFPPHRSPSPRAA